MSDPGYNVVIYSNKYNCSVCGVDSAQQPLIPIRGVYLHLYKCSLQLPTLEYRCKDHMNYLRCSCCQELFDGREATVNQQYGYPCILCDTHSKELRCSICHKWRSTSKSVSLSARRCQGHSEQNIQPVIERPKLLNLDTLSPAGGSDPMSIHEKNRELIEQERIARMRASPRRRSLRGQLLRDLAYVAVQRDRLQRSTSVESIPTQTIDGDLQSIHRIIMKRHLEEL